MRIQSEQQADRAFSLIYTNLDEAKEACLGLIFWYGGDPLVVYEVDEYTYMNHRGFIILGAPDEEDGDLMEDLARSHATLVFQPPELSYDIDDQHVLTCEKILTLCPSCSAAFNIKEFTS